jgi:hypothetical protein
MKLLSVFCVSLLVVSCLVGCKQPPAATITEHRKDSIDTRIVYRDVPVPVPGEKVVVTEYIKCDSVTNKPLPVTIVGKGKKAFTKTTIDKDGKLESTGGCDSLTAVIQAKDSVISRYSEYTRKEVKPTIIYRTRTIDWWARIVAIVAILYTGYRLRTVAIRSITKLKNFIV